MNELLEMEQIRQLKARYMRSLDTNDWELFGSLFTEDCIAAYSGGKYSFEGRDAIVKFMSDNLSGENMLTLHQVHTPELEFFGELRAKGTWYLEDTVINLESKIRIYGAGIYHDEYRKINGKWYFSRTGYERTYECAEPLDPKHKVLQNMFSQ
ncbi:MAG: nuclear transport factor 2 family protein [Pseudomonadales bacterium]